MQKFKVYRRHWLKPLPSPRGEEQWAVAEMRPVMTLNAKTPEAALRIAKQKGEVAPIIGEADHA